MNLKELKVALVFDWMTTSGGAEKVNFELMETFPKADIYTSILNEKVFPNLKGKIKTSFLQKFPFAKKKHQIYLQLMPMAYESFDLSGYDLVISSSHSCSKGVITKPETLHICYCHNPMRYAWDNWQNYINSYTFPNFVKKYAKKSMHKIRIWDKASADRVDFYIANSTTSQRRIKKFYKKESKVLFPSIQSDKYHSNKSKNFFLAVGRLTPYKKFDLLIETFNKNGLPLKIVGTGIQENELKQKANSNIQFLGFTEEKELKKLYSECLAFLFPQLEDFGITPLEAMSSGKPVIAYKKGGALDSIKENKTGIFFEEQTPASLQKAIEKFLKEKDKFKAEEIIKHAKKFDSKNFKKELLNFIEEKWQIWEKEMR